jgi:hypothetical protein
MHSGVLLSTIGQGVGHSGASLDGYRRNQATGVLFAGNGALAVDIVASVRVVQCGWTTITTHCVPGFHVPKATLTL